MATACVSARDTGPAGQAENLSTAVPTLEDSLTEIRYLALGDSFTIGEAVPEAGRWPVQLAAMLREAGVKVEDPDILARTGWTTGELAAAIAASDFDTEYELVSLLIGANNQFRGYALEDYRGEFAALVEQAIDLAGGDPGRVIVLSIPDWGMTSFAERDARSPAVITEEIAEFNRINREESERIGVAYVDIFPISELAYDDPTLIAGDGLHPSAAQYALWAQAALPVVQGILGR
ncbi:MAG TPA: SGNH/GDSL hydrolase family protein [Anaerolineales bacterium]|nr:SGNH/GDSL hydrolase family protein [Anaerolineales bacterium]